MNSETISRIIFMNPKSFWHVIYRIFRSGFPSFFFQPRRGSYAPNGKWTFLYLLCIGSSYLHKMVDFYLWTVCIEHCLYSQNKCRPAGGELAPVRHLVKQINTVKSRPSWPCKRLMEDQFMFMFIIMFIIKSCFRYSAIM